MKKAVVVLLSSLCFLIASFCIYYNVGLKAVGTSSEEVDFLVSSGSTYYDVISNLKSEGLIRNELCFKLYVKFNSVNSVEAGTYKISKNMSVKDIVNLFKLGNTYNPDSIVITFKEGKNMRSIASTIALYTDNSEEDVYNLLSDKSYLEELINNYWFISNDILNENIYYSLEGYLYPNTYEFNNKSVSVKEIFKVLLDETDKQLSNYKTDLMSNKYSIHEILTLASIIELEGGNSSDKASIASVFYNRLNSNMPLGSDVTTYYAEKIELSDRDLYASEINDNNYYNTRSDYLAGKLPVGPICNPSIDSINAALYPTDTDYYYFVSDKTGKTYFSKTYSEHNNTISSLKEEGLWYEYE